MFVINKTQEDAQNEASNSADRLHNSHNQSGCPKESTALTSLLIECYFWCSERMTLLLTQTCCRAHCLHHLPGTRRSIAMASSRAAHGHWILNNAALLWPPLNVEPNKGWICFLLFLCPGSGCLHLKITSGTPTNQIFSLSVWFQRKKNPNPLISGIKAW